MLAGKRVTGAPTFVDVFAGCGGLSLGLMCAGWRGIFAIEGEENAFKTLNYNLIEGRHAKRFDWPAWLPKEPYRVQAFLKRYASRLRALRGQIDLVAGGPPCQGFSYAGMRKHDDPRNRMFEQFVEMVDLLRPALVLFENVRGIATGFGKTRRGKPFLERVCERLQALGYSVFHESLKASEFGVAQLRPRHFLIAVDQCGSALQFQDPFELISAKRVQFLESMGLPRNRAVTVREAISDMEVAGKTLIPSEDSPAFNRIDYRGPETAYQRLMHAGLNGQVPNSLRLPRHKPETIERFTRILKTCKKGVGLSQADRSRLGIKKHCIVPLDPNKPSHTLTTLPDDFLHYSEPRILTVREYARLQSFPDWFSFLGKYTTGGPDRRRQCPRYTQVGNAVPPFVAQVIGAALMDIWSQVAVRPENVSAYAG
jgi:DNA (cytosine-5)-methyltransferase 1